MPAMHDEVRDAMVANLEEKCKLMLRLKPFSMTHEECLSLVCPPEHVRLLIEASKIANTWGGREMKVALPAHVDCAPSEPEITFTLSVHYKDPPLAPKNPVWQADAPRDLVDRVVDWAFNRYEVGRKFGMAKHVLLELNRLCTHGSQLTYLMPTVSHLCVRGKSSRMDTWLDRFGTYKPVKNAPALSLALRKATGDAAALLTTLSLLGDDIPEPEVGEVAIKVTVPRFTFEGGFVERI